MDFVNKPPEQSDFRLEGGRLEDVGQLHKSIDGLTRHVTLAELQKEYALFTHGVYQVYGNLPCDPVKRFLEENAGAGAAYFVTSSRPVFSGISSFFDQVLTAVDLSTWPKLRSYLDSICILHQPEKFYARSLRQRIPIIDFLAFENSVVSAASLVEIDAYGLDSNRGLMHFVPPMTIGLPVRLIRDQPEKETLDLANLTFNRFG